MLVRTKAQNKIDVRIRLLFEHGSCDVWVKESPWYSGKQNKFAVDSDVVVDAAYGPLTEMQNKYSVSENAGKHCTKHGCSSFIDPILGELINRPEWTNEHMWYDPIEVNETAGWLMVKSVATLRPDSHTCEGQDVLCDDTSSSRSKPRNSRVRPRNKSNQQQCDMQVPTLSKSCLETLDTWNTAKLLGISSSDEGAVITGLRKSKRLLIVDGKPD